MIYLYGGSFNPLHNGHLAIIRHFAGMKDARLLVAPTVQHAFGKSLTPFETRAQWVKNSCPSAEILRADSPYMAETCEAILKNNPGETIRLVVGSDILWERHKWHRWDDLMQLVELVIIARPGVEPVEGYTYTYIDLPEVSSSYLRTALPRGEGLDLVPADVAAYWKGAA
jgi:nicotinate-nucleotide adenylyltransferase